MKVRIFQFLFLIFFHFLFAQKEHISSFNSISVTYKFHPQFFFWSEGQIRGNEDFSYPDYYEIKGGIGYNLTENHKPFVGIGRYGNYKNHLMDKEEFRIWLQDVIDVKTGKFKLENRFRAEKSWFYEPQKAIYSDRIRLRYRLNISVPLNTKTVKKGTISANVYDEVFFITTEKPLFARNRLYGGFSYQIDDNFAISTGYLLQREFSRKSNKNLHYLYFALNISIDRSKTKTKEIVEVE